MPHRTAADHDVIARQEAMLRLAERDHDLTINRLEAETGIPAVTLRTYKRDTMMPLAAFVKLCGVIPDSLTSLVLEPAGKRVETEHAPDGDAHALARDGSEYNVEYLRATDPTSEAGPSLSPRERARLADIHRRMKARKVAA